MPGLPTRTVHGSSRAPAYAPARPHVRESLSDSERAAPSPIVVGSRLPRLRVLSDSSRRILAAPFGNGENERAGWERKEDGSWTGKEVGQWETDSEVERERLRGRRRGREGEGAMEREEHVLRRRGRGDRGGERPGA